MEKNIRSEVTLLAKLGRLPSEGLTTDPELILQYQELLKQIQPPVTLDEAGVLLQIFGSDECYGLAWTLLHLVETAPGWPDNDLIKDADSKWLESLKKR